MGKSKRKFHGGRGGAGAGGKKKRRKISLEKLSKMNKGRIEREKERFLRGGAKETSKNSDLPTVPQEVTSSSDDEEQEQEQMSSYQQLLANLGARISGEASLSDEEDEDLDESEGDDRSLEDGEEEEGDGEEGEGEDGERTLREKENLFRNASEKDEDAEDSNENIGSDKNEVESEEEEEEVEGEEEEEEEEEEEDEEEEEGDEHNQGDDEEADKLEEEIGAEKSRNIQGQDPFHQRVGHELSDDFVSVLSKGKALHRCEEKWPSLGKMSCASFDGTENADMKVIKSTDLADLHIPKRVASSWRETNASHIASDTEASMSPLQRELFSILNSYKDLVYPERSCQNAEEVRLAYCLHILSHIIKSRNLVQKHNNMLSANPDLDTESMRDQGLTRPRVLVLVPFRNAALQLVQTFAKLLIPEGQSMSHRKRFLEEYGEDKDTLPSKLIRPEDWEETFAGNIDDHFRLGLAITRKSFKLYSTFYSSDIIIASPLGLRTVIGAQGEKQHEFDFLSSIELLVMDQADVFLMQNWQHITHIMDHLHLQPKESHDVDFSRVRLWALNKWNKYYRQTLVFSAVSCPEINALVSKYCANWAGRVAVGNAPTLGTIGQVAVQLPQVFHRIECDSYASSHDRRFQFFISKILPQYRESLMTGTLIFIPSYFDFVRVRNYFRKQEINFAQICEYTSQSNISRARMYMMQGTRHTLIITERFHFFRRYKIRGIHHIVFYQLPTYPHFYSELCNMLEAPAREGATQELTCSVMYTKYDAQRLGGVVGLQRNTHMLSAEKAVHMLVSGDG